MATRTFLDREQMVRYVGPSGLGNDGNDHAIAKLKFQMVAKEVEYPARLTRWILAQTQCEGSRNAGNDFDMEAVTLFFSHTPGTEVYLTIPHVTLNKFTLQADKEDASVFYLRFQAQIQVDNSNGLFVACQHHRDVCMRIEKTEADLQFEEAQAADDEGSGDADAEAGQGALNLPDVDHDAEDKADEAYIAERATKNKKRKPGTTLPRQLGGNKSKKK